DYPVQAECARQLPPLIARELDDLKRGLPGLPELSPAVARHPAAGTDSPTADQIRRLMDRMIGEEQQVHAACLGQTRAVASAQARALMAASAYRVCVLLAGCMLILRQQVHQRHIERMRRQSEEFFRNAFDHAATGMVLADQNGRWVKVNRALCELVGYTDEQLLRTPSLSITFPEHLATERAAVEELRAGRVDRHQLETRYRHKDGHVVWALVTKSLVRDENGRPQTFISQIQDVTERKLAEDRLRHQSLHDGLTGLPNRLLFLERLRQAIDRANEDPGFRVAVLFMDLDRFKLINDTLGHAAGDKLLVAVAERLRRCVSGADSTGASGSAGAGDEGGSGPGHTVARLAGDEFTVLLQGFAEPGEAEQVADRILRELAEPVEFGGRPIRPSASIGIVHTAGRRHTAAAQLMADADAALYKAKAAGRGRHAVFDADAQQSALERLRLASELRHAVEREQFELRYQPIVSLLDARVAGFEAMLRWNHPERGLLAPEHFLDLAEETGLSVPLGDWVLQQASRQLADWATVQSGHPSPTQRGMPAVTGGEDLFMIVALSRKQLADQGLARRVRDLQAQRQEALSDGWLRVTIAEPDLMQNPESLNGVLTELRSAGVRVWVDNFGSGVTSLACMRSAALDGLKIDGRVVGSATGRRDYAAVVHSVLELARNLRLQVVADGLETADQVVLLQAMGCDLGQGAYFGLPLAAGEAQKVLQARSPAVPARSA
ncbi:MAG TPA: EAL domain-containing protein, partial [Tepidisphaeraceae bacterium]|nr:EAL domain-containing protein [Tepidisphaeraceae bacterium]